MFIHIVLLGKTENVQVLLFEVLRYILSKKSKAKTANSLPRIVNVVAMNLTRPLWHVYVLENEQSQILRLNTRSCQNQPIYFPLQGRVLLSTHFHN